MARYEVRNVLTFWKDRGWHDPQNDGGDYNSDSIVSGYQSLNEVVNDLSRRVTIHSVSYSQIIFPVGAIGVTAVRLFATVVYTGPSALGIYGAQSPHGPDVISANTTVLEVQ